MYFTHTMTKIAFFETIKILRVSTYIMTKCFIHFFDKHCKNKNKKKIKKNKKKNKKKIKKNVIHTNSHNLCPKYYFVEVFFIFNLSVF